MTTARMRLRRLSGQHRDWSSHVDSWQTGLMRLVDTSPVRLRLWAAGTAGAVMMLAAGAVAGGLAAVYCALAATALTRHRADSARRRHREQTRHAIALLAADLRAGADAGAAVPSTFAGLPDTDDAVCRRAGERLVSAASVAGQVGAPIALLLDHLTQDLRAEAKVEATLVSHTAGSVASSHLLAALPIAGLGLGQALGVDAVSTLLYTPIGMVCAVIAVVLQLTGLWWSRRIVASVTKAVP